MNILIPRLDGPSLSESFIVAFVLPRHHDPILIVGDVGPCAPHNSAIYQLSLSYVAIMTANEPNEADPEVSIGIDLGTSSMRVAVWRNQRMHIICNELGQRKTPCYLAFCGAHILVGSVAQQRASVDPANTVFQITRMLGRDFDDALFRRDAARWPFKVVRASRNRPCVEVDFEGKRRRFFAEQLLSMLFFYAKRCAERYLRAECRNAVISAPCNFSFNERYALQSAAKIAGLTVLRTIGAPPLAALGYVEDTFARRTREQRILVFDFGGGSLDVALLRVTDKDDVYRHEGNVYEVEAIAGDARLGGCDIDAMLVEEFVAELSRKNLSCLDAAQRHKLRCKCVEAKHALSLSMSAHFAVDSMFDGSVHLQVSMDRARFQELCAAQDVAERCLAPVRRVLADANRDRGEVDVALFVGGGSRMPMVQRAVARFFGDAPPTQLACLAGDKTAMGASLEAAVLCGARLDSSWSVSLLDVTPSSLGIETVGGAMTRIIERNSRIPQRRRRTFTTAVDAQASLMVQVFEGEARDTEHNQRLGMLLLQLAIGDGDAAHASHCGAVAVCADVEEGAQPRPRIEVSFELDANDDLTVALQLHERVMRRRLSEYDRFHSRALSSQEMLRAAKEAQLYHREVTAVDPHSKWKREPHRVRLWLSQLGLVEHAERFLESGYDAFQIILETMDDDTLQTVGVADAKHRAHIMQWIDQHNARNRETDNDDVHVEISIKSKFSCE